MTGDRVELGTVDEPAPRVGLAELLDDRNSQELTVLSGNVQHLREGRQLAVDRPIRGSLVLPRAGIVGYVRRTNPADPATRKEGIKVRKTASRFSDVPCLARLVVGEKVRTGFSVPNLVRTRED